MTNDIAEMKKKVAELEKRVKKLETDASSTTYNDPNQDDMLLSEAIALAKPYDRVSASLLQRRLAIGYARAARILDQMEKIGFIGPAEGSAPRKVIK